jgi:hypothetical protein
LSLLICFSSILFIWSFSTMTTEEQIPSSSSRATNRTYLGWIYCQSLEGIHCLQFCGKITKAGREIIKSKQHLMGKRGNVATCSKCLKSERAWDITKREREGRQHWNSKHDIFWSREPKLCDKWGWAWQLLGVHNKVVR